MKSKLPLFSRCQIPGQGLLLGLALLTWISASAQNLVRNPDFEEPLGPDNWTIVYTNCGPDDFFVKGRTRLAHRDKVAETWDGDPNYWNKFGLHFKAGNDGVMHAYASQVISNLTPFVSYTMSAYMTVYEDVNKVPKVYMEAIGGAVTTRTVDVGTFLLPNPPYSRANYLKYATNAYANGTGKIELRLHFYKDAGTTDGKWRNTDGLFDHVSLMLTSNYTNSQPTLPYKVLSFARTNQDITLKWQTVMNKKYRIQVSTNILDPGSWLWVQRSPYLDTHFAATGTNFTFTTNLVSLFSYDPSFDPNVPLYFRIYSENFQP